MPNTGNVFPATAENVTGNRTLGTVWSQPADAISDNTLDTTCDATSSAGSQYLAFRNFGLSVGTPSGITVRVEASEIGGGTQTVSAQLQNDTGTLFGSVKTFVVSGTTKAVYTLGSITDVWGATLTSAIVNSPNFGFRIWFSSTHRVDVDYGTIAVEYVAAGVTVALTGVTGNGAAGTAVAVGAGTPGGGPFPGEIFPGPIFPGEVFPGAGAPTTDVTVLASSIAARVDAGTVVGSLSFPATVALTGVSTFTGSGFSGAGPGGGIFPGEVFPGQIFPGEVFPEGTTGAQPIGGVGIVIPATLVNQPAVVVNGRAGVVSAFPDRQAPLVGVTAEARAGTVTGTAGGSAALNGVTVAARAGTVVRQSPIVALTGVAVRVGKQGTGGGTNTWGASWGNSWGLSWNAIGSNLSQGAGIVSPRTTVAGTGAAANAANGLPTIIGVQNRPTLAGVLVNANAGFVTGGADKIAVLTGVAVNVRAGSVLSGLISAQVNVLAGTVAPSAVVALNGATANAEAGTLVAPRSKALVGAVVNANAGTVLSGGSLTGVVVTAAAGVPGSAHDESIAIPAERAEAGTLVPIRTVSLSGVQVNAVAGNAGVTVIGLTGVTVNSQAGFVAAGADKVRPLSGVAVNAEAGTISVAARSLTLNGVTVNAASGNVAVLDRSFGLTGVAVQARAGTATAIADRTAALTGVRVNAQAYFVATGNDIFTPLAIPGVSAVVGAFIDPDTVVHLNTHQVTANAEAGNVFASSNRTVALAGVGARVETGFINRDALALTGVRINAAVGSADLIENRRPATSVVVNVNVGFVTKQNDAIVQLTGVDVVVGAGNMSVGPPVVFGTARRHTGVRPARKTNADLATLDRELALMED